MPKIVISYRRSDTDVFAGRVRDRIASRFGDQSVFLDIDDIPLGKDFRVHIQDALSQSDVVVVVIGPKWLGPIKRGAARINDDTDPVRIEVEVALAKGLPIIPILVGNTGMPSASQLPASIREFSYVNAAKVDTGRDFHRDMDRVILSLTVLTARSPATTDPGTIKRLTITPVAAVRTRTRLSAVSLAGIVCLFVAAIAATAWSFRIDLLGSMERQQAAKVPGTPNDAPSATSPGPSVASITAAPTPSGPDRSMVAHAPASAASALKSPPAQPATNAVDPAVEFALAANRSSPHAAPASDSTVPAADSRVGIAPPHSAKAGDMGAEITTPPDQQAASVAPSSPSVRRVPSDPPPATLLPAVPDKPPAAEERVALARPAIDTVQAFYSALGRGDGKAAAALMLPEKRTGNFAPDAMTRFYSRLQEPLQLLSVTPIQENKYQVAYTFRSNPKEICEGSAIVTTEKRGERIFIRLIEVKGRC